MDPVYRARLSRHHEPVTERPVPVHAIDTIQTRLIDNVEKVDLADYGYWTPIVKQEARLDILYDGLFDQPRPTQSDRALQYQKLNRGVRNILQDCTHRIEQKENIEKNLNKSRIDLQFCKVYDAPGISDDFYSNVLHISSENILAAAFGEKVYTMPFMKQGAGAIQSYLSGSLDNLVTCVHWIARTNRLFAGFKDGSTAFIDTATDKIAMQSRLVRNAITCAASGRAPEQIYFGSRDNQVVSRDLRVPEPSSSNIIATEEGSICGLALSSDESRLAVGTNNNKVKIYDLAKRHAPCVEFSCFEAAVKALAWSPWEKGLLFAGGGTADPSMKALSTSNGTVVASINQKYGQITGIHAIGDRNKLISCHGYHSNSVVLWNYNKGAFRDLAVLPSCHKDRVLHSSLNADKTALVTGSADETLRAWKLIKQEAIQQENVKETRVDSFFDNPHTRLR